MVQSQYSVAQRIAFAGLTLGFLMCLAGVIPPFWVTAKVSLELFSMHGGLWWSCVDFVTPGSECDVNSLGFDKAGAWVIRVCSVVNVILSLVCALVALCRSCCCCGGKTVCHGVMTFFAGAAGIAVVVVFSQSMEDFFFFKLSLVQYGWAFYVYIVGSALMTITSFVLCFAPPTNPSTPMIFNGVGQVSTGIQPMTNVQINQPISLQNNVASYTMFDSLLGGALPLTFCKTYKQEELDQIIEIVQTTQQEEANHKMQGTEPTTQNTEENPTNNGENQTDCNGIVTEAHSTSVVCCVCLKESSGTHICRNCHLNVFVICGNAA